MADVHRVRATFFGHEQGQPIAQVDEVHPPLQPGRSCSGHLFHGGACVSEEVLAEMHALRGPGMILRCVEEQSADGRISTFPPDQLVVVHLREDVVIAEALGVFVELLAPADEHRLKGGVSVEHGGLVGEQISPMAGEGLDGRGFRTEEIGGGDDIGEDIRGIGWRMAEGGEMVEQPGDGPAELGAGRMAARHRQAGPAMFFGQGAQLSARSEGADLGSSVLRLREGGEGFLGVAAVAAGDDEGGRPNPPGDAVVVPIGHRNGG